MSEWTAWGALRPTETFPPAISSLLGLRHWGNPARDRRSEPLNPSWEKRHPNLHGPAPPSRAAWVGFGHLGKTAHFTGTETLPLAIPHKGTKLGALARRQGLGSPAARLRDKASSANPLLLHKLQKYPLGTRGNSRHRPRPEGGNLRVCSGFRRSFGGEGGEQGRALNPKP